MAEDRIKCPVCAELIKPDAKKCRFCGEWLEGHEVAKENGALEELPGLPDDEPEGGHENGSGESDWESPEPARKIVSTSKKKGRRFPWLRIILVIAYVAIIAVLVCSERNARQTLREAQAKEEAKDPNGAFELYGQIVGAFPFSFAFIEAREGLRRICDSDESKLPRPSWLEIPEAALEILRTKLDRDLNVCEVYLLSFVTWPACAVLLALVFLTRILRPGMALFVLVLLAVAVVGSVVQLSWYETILPKPIAKGLIEEPVVLFSATYALLVVTAVMALTATRKHKRRDQVSKKLAVRTP